MIKSGGPGQQGFTLLEIMIALVLIALVAVPFIELSSANLRNLAKSDDCIELLTRANAKMRGVLELERFTEKTWTETDNNGYAYEIAVTEIEKERSDFLPVRLMQITVKASPAGRPRVRAVTLKTSRLSSKADVLGGNLTETVRGGAAH